jgi:hypothetical protein
MIKENEFRVIISEFLTDYNVNGYTSDLIDDLVSKVYPPKVKKIKIIKHNLLDDVTTEDNEELELFNEDPLYFLRTCDLELPSFSFNKGSLAEAEEGEEFFVRVNGVLHSFTIHEGECVQASWDGSIYGTDFKNLKIIPSEAEINYNLVKYPKW